MITRSHRYLSPIRDSICALSQNQQQWVKTFQCCSEGDQKKNKKNEEGAINDVLKFDLHCKGCVEKISRSLKRIEGVKKVSADMATNKLTVSGKVGDPVKLKVWIESKTNKKVDLILISPQQPKKVGNGGDANMMNKTEEQKSEKKTKFSS
ncbi:hypothetical protein Sjap_013778 [Stephania japonica]|uniref:HMA domain-containing protein n=1 Tax=Stephania japonica TaxID=461633 RepID=A0AAP0IYJ3_9MAGN